MKYPALLVVTAVVMLLVGLGIRMHADGKYMNKMYYHTTDSGLYQFHDVFTERKLGDHLQTWSIIVGSIGGLWFVVVAMRREKGRRA